MRLRRTTAVLIGSGLVAAGVSPAAAGTIAGSGLCHHHVGGTTVSYFAQYGVMCRLWGPGTFTIAPGGSSLYSWLTLQQNLRFLSAGTATGGGITLEDSSVFENAGAFHANGGFGGGSATLVRNDAGATWTNDSGYSSHVNAPMVNDGAVFADHSNILMPQLQGLDDGVLSGGTYRTDQAFMMLSKPVLSNETTLVEGPGSNIVTAQGKSALASLAANSGTLQVDVPQHVGPLTNTGTLQLGSLGRLSASGPVALSADSALTVAVTTGSSGPAYGQIATHAAAAVGGTLTVSTDPAAYPVPGSTYTLVSAPGGVSGRFDSVTGLDLPDGDHYDLVYTDTAVLLVVVSGQAIPLTVSSAGPAAVGQGARGYQLTIQGTGFAPGAQVGFGDAAVLATDTTVVDNTEIVVKVDVGAQAAPGPRDVKVRLGSVVAVCAGCLTVDAGPVLDAVSGPAAAGAAPALLTLTGSGFGYGMTATITGRSTAVKATIVDPAGPSATLRLVVPPRTPLGRYSITQRNYDGGLGGCSRCLLVIAPPTIGSVAPTTIGRGKTVTLTVTGTNLTADATFTGPPGVGFGAVDLIDSTQLTVPIVVSGSAAPGPGHTITLNNGAAGGFGAASFTGLTIT